MRYFFFAIILLPVYSIGQTFLPIPPKLKSAYQFNLQKNFFVSEADYYKKFSAVTDSLALINTYLDKDQIPMNRWGKVIRQYAKAEADYRVIDLYLFLRFAVNMNDTKADMESDSISKIIRKTRTLIKQKIAGLPADEIVQIIKTNPALTYYVNRIRDEKLHLLSPDAEKLTAPYAYTRSSRFYDEALKKMKFEKLITPAGEIDVIKERSSWENNPDTAVQNLGQKYVLKGYSTQKDFIGFNYIQFIKGLNAFAETKNFTSLIDEKLHQWEFSDTTLQSFYKHIIEGVQLKKELAPLSVNSSSTPLRFTIVDATSKLEKALAVLGTDYRKELSDLLNPANGRIDLAGEGNRIPIRGTASVYPIYPSIFYALNYEGYLIDLSLLAHEAGHAVQASLMYKNDVPLIYAAGPAYFTESFGKFNELLLFDYLSINEKDISKKKIFTLELNNRIDVLFGSTLEAYVEYSLIKGISDGSIKTPDDLDSVTQKSGTSISPDLFKSLPEYKGLWMLLETNYQAPLHNVNDMIASALAIRYYQLFKADKKKFVKNYIALLKQGYTDSPANLLKKLEINIQDVNFIKAVVDYAVKKN